MSLFLLFLDNYHNDLMHCNKPLRVYCGCSLPAGKIEKVYPPVFSFSDGELIRSFKYDQSSELLYNYAGQLM